MLTVLLTTDTPANNFSERYKEFIDTILKYEDDFEVIFLAKNDYPDKDAFRILASKLPNHQFVALDELNNKNEVILTGLAQAQGDDILLCTWDTNIIVIDQLLQKRKEGCDLVFVKNKKSKLKKFFEGLGTASYNFGTRFIKHNFDMFAETDVQLIDGRVANLICSAPDESFELRVTNNYKQLKQGIIENEKVYENTRVVSQSSPVFSLGIVSFFYLIGLLALIVVTPIFNNGIYSWWALLVIAVWLILGIVGLVSATKSIYKTRNANPVRLNRNGEPILIVQEFIENGESVTDYEQTDFEKRVDDLFVQEQKNQSASPATLIRKTTNTESGKKNNKTKMPAKKKAAAKKTSTKEKVKKKTEKTKKAESSKKEEKPATNKVDKNSGKTKSKSTSKKPAAKKATKGTKKEAKSKATVKKSTTKKAEKAKPAEKKAAKPAKKESKTKKSSTKKSK